MRRSLLVLLLVAAFLRLWGIGFGLDLQDVRRTVLNNQVDERGMVQSVLAGLLRGDLHPGDFLNRGAAAYYVLGAVDAVVLAPLALAGEGGWEGQLARLDENPSLLHLLHRLVSALAGVASVAVLVRLCRRELGGRAALLAGAMLATSYLHVRESHLGTVDALWVLLTLLTVDQALLLAGDPRPARYAAAGLLAGATAATKYFGVLLAGVLLAAHLCARATARRAEAAARSHWGWTPARAAGGAGGAGGSGVPGHGRLIGGLLLAPVAFVALSPYLFFAAGDLIERLRWGRDNIGPDLSPAGLLRAASHHAHWTLAVGLGEPVLVLALCGCVLGWRRGGAARLLALCPLLLAPSMFLTGHHPVRFGLPVAVLLVPPAALALEALLQLVRRALRPLVAPREEPSPRAELWVGVPLVALVLLPSTLRSLAFDGVVAREDTRLEMQDALAATGAGGDDVLGVGLHGLPRVHSRLPIPYVDFHRRNFRGEPPTLADVLAAPPRFILRDLSAGLPDDQVWDEVSPLVAQQYHEVLRLDPRPDPAAVTLPDPAAGTPAHMIPFANPWAMTRPGSALVLYERNAEAERSAEQNAGESAR